ncbi:uncharacterized protein F5891DRAFT_1054794 [Suillus fuscotomentosus]|uniref:Heterokaryon incompatibility domain-containing protein n=1 Tax=Suillus fuscotomentosus TaxID=1912939 RepID=A0AAD4HHB5_9AGAM|nr:uncharacterized protein F5891DRAFT_1054794 [Suillus fuscotomentosus]KAG1896216.1 hypothetical protein F5891DRAFT_1054794 [Suillus fuscotomentosus]
MNHVLTTTGQKHPQCYSSQLKPFYHGATSRYTSPSSGKCKRLVVQSVNPSSTSDWNERNVRSNAPLSTRLAYWLTRMIFSPSNETFLWLFVWPLYIIALLLPSKGHPFTIHYKPYLRRFVGQLWAARSPREYSLRARAGEDDVRVRHVTHALYPRILVVFDGNTRSWERVDVEAVARRRPYVAVSYRYADVIKFGRETIIERVRYATLDQGFDAYWLDLECLLEDKSQDLFRMSDVYRLASFTLIILTDESVWSDWGSRVWTLPEALLSRELRYMAGNNAVTPISLIQIASLAYRHHDKESQIIHSYGLGKDPLERLARNLQLKEAIWRRESFSSQITSQGGNSQGRYRAEKVYALMGFFEHRILPDPEETELQALARLFMANDNDRIADRMISMFPKDRSAINQWYTNEDEYGAKLWDIEPAVQVIGITSNGSLVLDGCRMAAIRWKNFPSVAFATRRSIRRLLALAAPYVALFLFVTSCAIISLGNEEASASANIYGSSSGTSPSVAGGGVILAFSLILLICSPVLTCYAHSGRVVLACPWLIGVKGVISAQEASDHLYGHQMGDSRRTLYTPSGSPLAKPRESDSPFREGHVLQYEAALATPPFDPIEGHMFTLVDTISGTIYYFRAHRPPTVCLFTGSEGGQGRFVLASEECSRSELRRETVLRMPTFISAHMHTCDWMALGGKPQD